MRWSLLAVTVGVFGLVLYGSKKAVDMINEPRGIRNNNPGNIRQSSTLWKGESGRDLDPAFEEFDTPEHGIRAIARIIRNYRDRYGLNTVRGIISRWAPSNENDTESYIQSVAYRLGVSADQVIDIDAVMPALVEAIIRHENGIQPYTMAQINAGIALA